MDRECDLSANHGTSRIPQAITGTTRVANITDFSVEVRNSENDLYFSRFLYTISKFSDILRILKFFDFFLTIFIVIGNDHRF